MAAEDIIIRHQNYIELTCTADDIGSKFDFDTDKTVADFIAALPLAESVKQYRKFVVVLDEKNE